MSCDPRAFAACLPALARKLEDAVVAVSIDATIAGGGGGGAGAMTGAAGGGAAFASPAERSARDA